MTSHPLRRALAIALIGGLASATWAADAASKSAPASTTKSGSTTSRSAKGTLPDPILLDGSTLPVEKKNEQGMIGDFELPGDENVRNGKVGGQQGGQPGGQQKPGVQASMPGIPNPLGGSQGGAPGQQNASLPSLPQAGGQSGQQQGGGQPGGQQAAGQQGGQPGGAQGGDQSGGALGGPADPNAKAEGVQVAQLGGEGSSQDSLSGGDKPPAVAIGDPAMRINTAGVGSGAIGAQQISINTQQHEKGTGSGGKGSGGAQGPNRAEKGRTMPAGL